ncbi:hypothetical protein [Lacisediminimonas profundi]|uniref:hypothetical protein n=1 Tax=Lacisediminimonas profundi TaxID=2603856 RepID=UPI00124BBDB7|nr:hypothetical protein [Lacisediminimonas profundi]
MTRQIGEHLVAAELGRMGLIATPFAGNVPNFDLLVANEFGIAIPVQVKAINGPSWQFNATSFIDIENTNGVQRIVGPKQVPYPGLICVFVLLRGAGTDEFFVMRFRDLQDYFVGTYKAGIRPKNPNSTHCAIWPKDLQQFKSWAPLFEALSNEESALMLRSRGQPTAGKV